MAKAIFTQEFNFDMRPERGVCISVSPSETPQDYPEKVISAAVKAGAATRYKAKSKSKDDAQA